MSSARPPRYWLADQLPRPLAEDPFLRRFSLIFEEIADSVRDPVLSFAHYLDADTAPPEFVRWMIRWLGLRIDASVDEDRQRAVLRSAGSLLGWRGTRRGLQGLLESLVGGPVRVIEHGGVFREGSHPAYDPRITIQLDGFGGIEEQRLRKFIETELPAGTELELVLGRGPGGGPVEGGPDRNVPPGNGPADGDREPESPGGRPSPGG